MRSCNSNRGNTEINSSNVIGLVPAAGFASRISPLPCSKEIYPINLKRDKKSSASFEVVSACLMESMRQAGVEKVFMVIRTGKWDIPQYYRDGLSSNQKIAYLVTDSTPGTPYTVDKAYPFLQNHRVAFGFPDILIQPLEAFDTLLKKQQSTQCDLVLGLFPAQNPEKVDMVDLDKKNRIRNIQIKPKKTDLTYTWILAVWSPVFTRFIHTFLKSSTSDDQASGSELYMGDIINKALSSKIIVESVIFQEGSYLDIGTTEDLEKAINLDLFDFL